MKTQTPSRPMSRALLPAFALFAAVLLWPASPQAGLFTNGNFETPDTGSGVLYTAGNGPTGWTFGGAGGALWDVGSGIHPAYEGQQFASLNNAGLGSISQTFSTLPGGSYTCNFLLSGIADGTADAFGVDVQASGSALQSYSFNTGGAANFLVPTPSLNSYSFTAAGFLTTLSFSSTAVSSSGQAYGPVLDDIQVSGPPPGVVTVVQTNSTSSASQLAFPASATDLINVGAITLDSAVHGADYAVFNGSSAARLNDGDLGLTNDVSTTAFDLDGAWTSTYYLNTAAEPYGYAITEVRSMAGWGNPRASQKYDLYIRTLSLPIFVYYGTYNLSTTDSSSMISLTDSTGVIASGADAIQFVFSRPDQGNGSEGVMREVDVFGYALPEPASLSLLLAGALLAYRRRQR